MDIMHTLSDRLTGSYASICVFVLKLDLLHFNFTFMDDSYNHDLWHKRTAIIFDDQ